VIKLYSSLAEWWPLLSPPEEYAEEAATYARCLTSGGNAPCETLVEFGSGGGNNASFLKRQFVTTLVDASPDMLSVSRRLNPDCEHVLGDMRNIRLGREYDCVFIHDAICYMTSRDDLKRAVETAFVHCRPGGTVLIAPDYTRENFCAATDHGGCDGADGRGLRYLEWTWDPDPADDTYTVDYAYVMRDGDGSIQVEHDRHVEGLFRRLEWLEVMEQAGFEPRALPFEHSEIENRSLEMFLGIRPAA
jgi:SAM-dependent methyltransferase